MLAVAVLSALLLAQIDPPSPIAAEDPEHDRAGASPEGDRAGEQGLVRSVGPDEDVAVQRAAPAVAPVAAAPVAVAAAAPIGAPSSPPGTPVAPPSSEVPTTGLARTRVDLPLEVELHGQLFFGVSADARQGWDRDVALDRARIEVRGRLPRVLTVIEADVSEQRPLKDAFVRFDGPATTRLTAGQFKAPFLERENRSAWSLPLVDRGIVTDELVARSGLGGRRVGAMGAVRPWDGALELAAGIFRGTPAIEGEPPPEDYAARLAARPWETLELGVSGYRAGRGSGQLRQGGSGFVLVDVGPFTGTFEAVAGRIAQGPFTAGLALLEFTQRLTRDVRLTPMAGFEALRLRGALRETGTSTVLGAVLGVRGGLKLKVQWERARRPEDPALANAMAVELATRF